MLKQTENMIRPRITKPKKESFAIFVAISAILHGLVCIAPSESKISEKQTENVIQISMISVAAPSSIGNAKVNEEKKTSEKQTEKPVEQLAKIETSSGNPKPVEQEKSAEVSKKLHAPTANNNGNAQSTIIPMLTEADYIQQVAPQYPPRAIELGMEGVVIVKALISSAGEPKDVEILDSSGYNLLDSSALKAVSKWRFKTANLNLSREMWVQVPVKFMIR
jgi:protein TonB